MRKLRRFRFSKQWANFIGPLAEMFAKISAPTEGGREKCAVHVSISDLKPGHFVLILDAS
jgi:hypothetical protein